MVDLPLSVCVSSHPPGREHDIVHVDYDTIYAFANALHDANVLTDAESVLSYFEKPYKWQPEYELWLAWDCPQDGDENWQAFVDAVLAPDPDSAFAERYWRDKE